MPDSLFHFDVSAGNLVFRAVVVYLSVLILLRLSGKRQLAQMSPTEFVAVLLISNAVQNAMNGGDNSLAGGIVLATALIVMSTLISFLTYKSEAFTVLFEGTPTLLIHKGKVVRKNMAWERLRESELKALLRRQGVHEIHEVETAVLESDGTFSITKKNDAPAPYVDNAPDSKKKAE